MNVEPLHLNFNVGHSMIRRMWLIVGLLLLALPPVLAQTVTTDKDDYAPGEVAIITGSGWINDEYVDVHFEEEPVHEHHHGYHDTKVDANGTWTIEYPIEDRHLGVKFTVIVEGKQSGLKASTTFTDGNVHFLTSGLPNGADVEVEVTYTPTTPSGAPEKTEVIKFKSQNNGGVAALDGTLISWFFKPVQLTQNGVTTTYISRSSNPTQSFKVSGNHTGKNGGVTGFYELCASPKIASGGNPANQTIMYGESVVFSVTASGNIDGYQWQESSNNGQTWTDLQGETATTYTLANPAVALSGKQYRVAITGCGTTLYSEAASLMVEKRPVTVTANSLSKVYGEADPALTYTVTAGSVVNNDTFSGSLEREAGENVRTYAINKGTLSLGSSYNMSYESAQFTINPKQVAVRLLAEDKVYDGSKQATASGYIAASDLVGSDQVDVTVHNAAFSDKNVGTAKTVTADVAITNSNYTLSNATASTTASITAKPIAGSFTAQNKVYDGTTMATVVESTLLGTISGDDISLTGGAARFADKNADTGKSVTLSGAALSGADKDNYTLTSVEQAQADITPRPASVTPNDVSKVYGTLDPVFSGKLEGFVAADEITAIFSRPLGEWVGEYDLVATLFPEEALRNYIITYNKGDLKITPAELVVTAHNASRTYGDENPEFTGSVSGIVREGEIEISYTSVATPESEIGTYAITPQLSGAALMNYNITATNGILTIEKAALSLQAHDKTRKYGEANPTFDGTFTGLKNNDPVTPSYSTDATATSNVGEYPITASLVDPKNKLSNYQVSITDGVLTILPASAEIHLSGLSKVYNGQAQGVEVATMPEGLALNITYNAETVAPAKAGSYAVVASLANSNYTAPDATGTLVIAPKDVTASLSNPGKVYDGTTAAPGTTARLNGIVSGDEVTAHASEAAFSSPNAGERTVSATVSLLGADAANYKLKQVNVATSTISKAPLTITAPSMSKYCGQDDPLTGYACTVTGAVNQEQIQTSYAIAGTDVLPASTDAKLANYEVTFVKGTLTINGLALDASTASTPRSVNEEVSINISVKDGETAVAGVKVDLLLDCVLRATATSSANGTATFNLGKLAAKVYSVQAVAGGNGCAASQVVYLPIYDPDGGFVTGGGWINSPREALATDPEVTGKANFGFVAKYKKGKNEVDGNTEFQFQNGNINFKSSSHTAASLVISGAKATYKGKGFINGGGIEYDFMVVATDGDISGGGGYDKFRIKIWNGGNVVYDNARGTAENAELGDDTRIGGGSIVIHENKSLNGGSSTKKLAATVTPEQLSASFLNYPNPYTDKTTITFSFVEDEQFALEVYDVKGARVRKTEEGMAEAGKVYEFEFSANTLPEGVYFARLTTSSGVKTIKMVLKK